MATKKVKKPVEEKLPTMARLIAEINKEAGETVIGRISEMPQLNIERISSNVKILDDAVGGGFPLGRIVEFYGLPSAGKSLISLLVIAEAQKRGLECAYIDCEGSFDPLFANKFGVDTNKLVLAQSSIGESTIDLVAKLLSAQPGVIVVDSVAAMITQGELDEPMEQQFMASKARLLSRGLAKLNTLNKKTLIIFINQLRSTMVLYGSKTTTTGGRALGHYASIRIEVKKGEFLTVDGKKTTDIIGQIISFQVTKNKTARPFHYGSFKFYYDEAKIE